MRLLNTERFYLKEFYAETPEYYVLSHKWYAEEPTYQNFVALGPGFVDNEGAMPDEPGMRKIQKFCELARDKGCQWVWIDTVCINKESSAELSEAINSMYRWYENAATCVVYLADVSMLGLEHKQQRDQAARLASFRASNWFTRGWTLQEMLAPADVEFYDMGWRFIGTKRQLRDDIADITGIDAQILRSRKPSSFILKTSIGVRMSWASKRKTTRVEDEAYCLLGIFGISMHLLYGEGENAFLRLQKKILKTTTDETMFVWSLKNSTQYFAGALAPRPSAFEATGRIRASKMRTEPILITKEEIELLVFNVAHKNVNNSNIILPLNCENDEGVVGVLLTNLHGSWYRRANAGIFNIGQNHNYSLFYERDRPYETLKIPTTAPAQYSKINIGVLTSQPIPVGLRFNHHFLEPDVLLASLDPWELFSLSRCANEHVTHILDSLGWNMDESGRRIREVTEKVDRVNLLYPENHPFAFAARLIGFLAILYASEFDRGQLEKAEDRIKQELPGEADSDNNSNSQLTKGEITPAITSLERAAELASQKSEPSSHHYKPA